MSQSARATLNPDLIRRTNPNDEYELVQRVGGGTFGEVSRVPLFLSHRVPWMTPFQVYKARHLANGDFAAIKVGHPAVS